MSKTHAAVENNVTRRWYQRLAHAAHTCLLLGILCQSNTWAGDATPIAVLYPDVPEPYRSVFSSVIGGIEERAKTNIKRYALAKDHDLNALREWLAAQRAGVIIALGQRGLNAATALHTSTPVVLGAVLLTANLAAPGMSGISLATDPDKLFGEIRALAPRIKRIHVVYDPAHNVDLMGWARKAAQTHGLELLMHEAAGMRPAAQAYLDMFKQSRSDTDAVWLPPEDSAEDSAIQSEILRQAWDMRLPVFSTNPTHVKRGVLFALYPDSRAMGRSLAELALRQKSNGGGGEDITLLRDVLQAVNLRTADHLGLTVSAEARRRFSLVFPEP